MVVSPRPDEPKIPEELRLSWEANLAGAAALVEKVHKEMEEFAPITTAVNSVWSNDQGHVRDALGYVNVTHRSLQTLTSPDIDNPMMRLREWRSQ